MKAVVIHEYGGPEVLKYEDHPDPAIGPGEVLIRVAAASINPIDTILRSGIRKDRDPLEFPAILGWDVAGHIAKVGKGVSSFGVGDPVLAWADHAYAELCAVKADLLARIAPGMRVEDAAAVPLVTLTGVQLISEGARVRAGQSVLVSGALGAVGRAAVFAAKQAGAIVTAGVRREQLSAAKSLGADATVALDEDADLDRLMPVDAVANTVRGKTAERLLGKVKPGGVFASVTGAPANAQQFKSVKVVTFVSRPNREMLQSMADAVGAGRLVIPIGLRLPLRDAAEGHAAIEKGGAGKVLLLP